jgi:hypothetical protein
MHVLHPLRARFIWIGLALVKVFGNLTENAHKIELIQK